MPGLERENVAAGLDPVWLAMSKLRRGHLDDCINRCTAILGENQLDQVRANIWRNLEGQGAGLSGECLHVGRMAAQMSSNPSSKRGGRYRAGGRWRRRATFRRERHSGSASVRHFLEPRSRSDDSQILTIVHPLSAPVRLLLDLARADQGPGGPIRAFGR
jgi:hypothetical protein